MARNSVLETLQLYRNQLDDNDAIAIAGALKYNTSLRDLQLTSNNISKIGWAALRKAEFDDTSLNSAADSNHTCAIWYPPEDEEIQWLDTSEMNGDRDTVPFDAKYVRQKKIFSFILTK